jgi:hypothetical protein
LPASQSSGGYSNPIASVCWDPFNPGTIYLGGGQSRYAANGNGKIWKATDYGLIYANITASPIPADAIVHGIACGSGYRLIATDKGLFRTTDDVAFTEIDLTTMGIGGFTVADLACADHTSPTYTVTSATAGFRSEHMGMRLTITTAGNWSGGSYTMTYVNATTVTLTSDPTNGSDATAGAGSVHAKVMGIAVAPTDTMHVYLSVRAGATTLFRGGCAASTDGGLTFALANTGLNVDVDATDSNHNRYMGIAVDPINEHIVYLCCQGAHNPTLYKTMNGAGAWSAVFTSAAKPTGWIDSLNSAHPFRVAVSPANASRIALGTSMFMFGSDNAAATWFNAYGLSASDGSSEAAGATPMGVFTVAYHPDRRGVLVAGAADVGQLSSKSSGKWWACPGTIAGLDALAYQMRGCAWDSGNADHLWQALYKQASDHGCIVQSMDGGVVFTVTSTGLPDKRCLQLRLVPGTSGATAKLWVVQETGNAWTSTGGATWTSPATLADVTTARCLAIDPTNSQHMMLALQKTAVVAGGLRETFDGGVTWAVVAITGLNWSYPYDLCFSLDGSKLFLANRQAYIAPTTYYGGVYRALTSEAYANWTKVLSCYEPCQFDRSRGGRICVATASPGGTDLDFTIALQYTDDDGGAWSALGASSLPEQGILSVAFNPHDENEVAVGTAGHGVLVYRPEDESRLVARAPKGKLMMTSAGSRARNKTQRAAPRRRKAG